MAFFEWNHGNVEGNCGGMVDTSVLGTAYCAFKSRQLYMPMPTLKLRGNEVILRRGSRRRGRRRRDIRLYARGHETLGWVRSSLRFDSWTSSRREHRRGRDRSTLMLAHQEWVWRKATDYDLAIQKRREFTGRRGRRRGVRIHGRRRRLPSLYSYERKKRTHKRKAFRRLRRGSTWRTHRMVCPRRWWDMKSRSGIDGWEKKPSSEKDSGSPGERESRLHPESRSSVLDYVQRWVERQWRGRRRLRMRMGSNRRREYRRQPNSPRQGNDTEEMVLTRRQRASRRRRRGGMGRRMGRLLIPNGYRNPSREVRRRRRPRLLRQRILRRRVLRRSVLSVYVLTSSGSVGK